MTLPESETSEEFAGAVSESENHEELLGACLIMRLGGRAYAFSVADVVLIAPKGIITRVPLSPPHLMGITTLRGRLMTVIYLDNMIEAGVYVTSDIPMTLPRLVVVRAGERELAVVADEIFGFDPGAGAKVPQRPDFDPSGIVQAIFTWGDKTVAHIDVRQLIAVAEARAEKHFTQGRVDA